VRRKPLHYTPLAGLDLTRPTGRERDDIEVLAVRFRSQAGASVDLADTFSIQLQSCLLTGLTDDGVDVSLVDSRPRDEVVLPARKTEGRRIVFSTDSEHFAILVGEQNAYSRPQDPGNLFAHVNRYTSAARVG